MAQESWPSPAYNSRNVTDAEYEKIAARFSDDGVYGDPGDTAVASAGGGLSVNIRANVNASVRGHAWTSGPTTVTLSVGVNTSGSTRQDRIVLQLDRATWTVRAVVKPGTPGGGLPALTQQTGDSGVFEVLLANVTVLNGAASVSVSRAERYVGTRVRPVLSSATTNPVWQTGELVYETDTKRLRLYDGDALNTVYGASGVVDVSSAVSGWSIVVTPVLQRHNGIVCLRFGQFKRTGGNLAGATDSRLPLSIPSTYRHPTRNAYTTAYITGADIGRLTIYSSNSERPGQVWLTQKPDMQTNDELLPGDVSWVVD